VTGSIQSPIYVMIIFPLNLIVFISCKADWLISEPKWTGILKSQF